MDEQGREVHRMNGSQVDRLTPWRCSVSFADTFDTDVKRWWDLDKGFEAVAEACLWTMTMTGQFEEDLSHRCEA